MTTSYDLTVIKNMSSNERPLLARDTSYNNEIREAAEEDALLSGQPISQTRDTRQRWREAGLAIWALAATVVVIILAVVVQRERDEIRKHREQYEIPKGKRNLIFMVSDGMGPASLEMARSWRQYTNDLPLDDILVLDQHFIGSSRTRSTSSIVTDSAAGATAFSCGLKSYNGAISVLPDFTPCGTLLEAAKKAGYMTGLVVTTRITDATPACFASHANTRAYEDLIAEHIIGNYPLGRMVDLVVGGGRCHFLPNTTIDSCRADDKDIVAMAKDKGFNYIDSRAGFDDLDNKKEVKLPLLALLAKTDIPYEIDRRHIPDQYPSEAEMAKFALKTLAAATAGSNKGFFIMIEGSRIDHAGHTNDPAAQVHETLAHDNAFAAALEFLNSSDDDGLLISTSDHETGGLSAAKQVGIAYPKYIWYPEVLANASNSASYVSGVWANYTTSSSYESDSHKTKTDYLATILSKHLGINDATPTELDEILESTTNPLHPPVYSFAEMISIRAQIGWSTHGHSGVDVNIYASDPKVAKKLTGNHENIEIGKFMAEYLDVDVDAVTKELVEKGVKTKPDLGLVGIEMESMSSDFIEIGNELRWY